MLLGYLKKMLLLMVLLPLTVTAVPVSINKPVTTFYWEHDGVNADGYEIECDGQVVITVIGNVDRSAEIADASLPDGPHECFVIAYNWATGTKLTTRSTNSVFFFTQNGIAFQNLGVLAAPGFSVR